MKPICILLMVLLLACSAPMHQRTYDSMGRPVEPDSTAIKWAWFAAFAGTFTAGVLALGLTADPPETQWPPPGQ